MQLRTVLSLSCTTLLAAAAAADLADNVGLTSLAERIGVENLPTGAGVSVGQVETPEGGNNYRPNPNDAEFPGKIFHDESGAGGTSFHATNVGRWAYGVDRSIAPDINEIWNWESTDWVTGGFLRATAGTTSPHPLPGPLNCINNSWIGSLGSDVLDNAGLRRADWVVDRDRILMCNGVANSGSNSPLLAFMFNGISVGKANGGHASNDVGQQYDGPGRQKPELVVPLGTTSDCTGVVTAAVALMVELARTVPGLSKDDYSERPEVIKSVLMTGAVHEDGWSNGAIGSGPVRGLTLSPLDGVYGAGTLNVDHAHRAFTGLRQDGGETVEEATTVSASGWSYDYMLLDDSRWWRVVVPETADEVSVLATWNRKVDAGFDNWHLADFDLYLWGDDGGEPVELLGDAGLDVFESGNVQSRSGTSNVEHLHLKGLAPGTYYIELRFDDTTDTVLSFFAMSWLFPDVACVTGDTNCDGQINVSDLLNLLADWGPCSGCSTDLDGDGDVDVNDLLTLLSLWGSI